jgi:hypothetical protein
MNLKILPSHQRKLWSKFAADKTFEPFYLAGGTAVAIHLEHRESLDYDFFRPDSFSAEQLVQALKKIGKLTIDSIGEGTFIGFLDNVKLSFFKYPYPLLEPPKILSGVAVAQLSDLAVMKLVAIAQRGTKKDFIDVHELLLAGWTIEAMFELADRKFEGVQYNKIYYLKSLTFFDDAESDPMPKMLKPRKWKEIKSALRAAVLDVLP